MLVMLVVEVPLEPVEKLFQTSKIFFYEREQSTFNDVYRFLSIIDVTNNWHMGNKKVKSRSIYIDVLAYDW